MGAPVHLRQRFDWTTRLAVTLWGLLAVAVSVKVVLSPLRHHFVLFRVSALNWWDGISLYDQSAGLFRYPPTFAMIVSPLAPLPTWLGNILWNLIGLGLLAFSIVQLERWVLPGAWTPRRRALILLLTLPGVFRGVWSSQSHTLSAACLFLAVAAVARKRYGFAGLFFAMAFHVKLAPLALALVFVLLYPRRLGLRFATALLALGLVPFLTQDPRFVVSEYARCVEYLQGSASTRWSSFRDAWHLWELTGLPFRLEVYRALQALAGCGVAAWALWLSRQSLPERRILTASLGAGACYMLLFGPAVEYNQWVLITPVLAWVMLRAFDERCGRTIAVATYVLTLFLGSGRIERALEELTGSALVTGCVVVGTLLFAGRLMLDESRRAIESRAVEPGGPSPVELPAPFHSSRGAA